jgi:8-oxo-dGTP diphosphatase
VLTQRLPCAGGIVFDVDGRLLLIRRGTQPALGSWSVPGGKCRPDEAPEAACVRELAEETGLTVEVERHAGTVERPGPSGVIFVIDDFVCRVTGGTLKAGDDAADARWVSRSELARLPIVDGLVDALADWDLLPR